MGLEADQVIMEDEELSPEQKEKLKRNPTMPVEDSIDSETEHGSPVVTARGENGKLLTFLNDDTEEINLSLGQKLNQERLREAA